MLQLASDFFIRFNNMTPVTGSKWIGLLVEFPILPFDSRLVRELQNLPVPSVET